MDLVVEDIVVVELKSVEAIAAVHEATVLTYLKLSGHSLGLLINFNVAILKDGVRRFVLRHEEILRVTLSAQRIAENAEGVRHEAECGEKRRGW